MILFRYFLISILLIGVAELNAQVAIEWPAFWIENVDHEIVIEDASTITTAYLLHQGDTIPFEQFENELMAIAQMQQAGEIQLVVDDTIQTKFIKPIPMWMGIIPPLIAIILALVFKEVITSLLIAIFIGAFIIQYTQHSIILAWFFAFTTLVDTYIIGALYDSGHLSVIVFSLLIGAMVSVISKNGGMQGVVNHISKYAKTAKSGQMATWFLGVAIFFDDFANTLIVGNTMRPITDRLKISREKLAYIVDSTAAPIAAIAFITTWIGAELGYIEDGIAQIDGLNAGAYATFIQSLAFSFYPLFALIFMLIIIWSGRDFGPMLKAELKARQNNEQEAIVKNEELEAFNPKAGILIRAYNAIIPIAIVIIGTILGLLYTGWDSEVLQNSNDGFFQKLSFIIGNSDSYQALLWSSMAALVTAIKLSVLQKTLKLNEAIDAVYHGLKTMLPAILILILAWSLALVIEELHTANFLSSLLNDSISPYLIPAVTFILAAIIAFSTGSSWGTMAILYPLMLPVSWEIAQINGLEFADSLSIFHNVVASVLAGAVLGDHCSPISDTTILSSLASSCNHIEHVRTQMPYALTVGLVAIVAGTVPAAFGFPFLLSMALGSLLLFLIVHYFGANTSK